MAQSCASDQQMTVGTLAESEGMQSRTVCETGRVVGARNA